MEWITEADGVFRGGGVKGIGLAGALSGFAEHPTKPVTTWVNVAGASAGAIIACYLALGHTAPEMVSLLEKTPFASFQDTPGGKLGAPFNFIARHGLARGVKFEEWFDGVLNQATFSQVRQENPVSGKPDWRLKLIAVDVTNHVLLVLPNDLADYSLPGSPAKIDPDAFSIARAARMSMSIPYFFEPVTLEKDGRPAVIIDGGTLSNFPVWLFDVDPASAGRPPLRPTFGFTLVGGRSFGGGLGGLRRLTPWPVRFGAEIFHTAQSAWDARFVSHSTRVRTVTVKAGDVGTTEFNLSKDRQDALLGRGREAAHDFLETFELAEYMNTFHASPSVAPA